MGASAEPLRRRPAQAKTSEPPFAVGDALHAIASTAKGRFAPGEESEWVRAVRVRVAGHVRRFGTLDQWRTVGAWLAQGGDAYRGVLGPSWVASDALADAMVRAAAWAQGAARLHNQGEIDVAVSKRVNGPGGVRVVTLDPLARSR